MPSNHTHQKKQYINLPEMKIDKQQSINKAQSLFDEGYACSQSILLTFADHFQMDLHTAKLVSSTFGGGMGRLRQKCGAVTGGFMVLGLKYGNTDPKDMETKLAAYRKVRELNQQVEAIHGCTNCNEILKKFATETEISERKHHQIICRKIVGDVASLLHDML